MPKQKTQNIYIKIFVLGNYSYLTLPQFLKIRLERVIF